MLGTAGLHKADKNGFNMLGGIYIMKLVPLGDRVIYSKYAGTEVKLGDDEYIIVKQSDILAVVSE